MSWFRELLDRVLSTLGAVWALRNRREEVGSLGMGWGWILEYEKEEEQEDGAEGRRERKGTFQRAEGRGRNGTCQGWRAKKSRA